MKFLDDRLDELCLFISRLRIKGENGNARIGNAEITPECLMQKGSFLFQKFLRDGFGHVLNRESVGSHGDTETVVDEHGKGSCEALFHSRSRNEYIESLLLIVVLCLD